MPRVDFYLLQGAGAEARQLFACRLAEKVYRLNNTVHIQTANNADARRMDELLWTFRDGSFVPHEITTATTGQPAPVRIGVDDAATASGDLLINLCDQIPGIAEAFPRVAELVSSDENCKQESRKRFTAYRDRGYTLETHNV